jgi:4-hydroxy-tetrahydrodipicolinate reductase
MVPSALTGPEIDRSSIEVCGRTIKLFSKLHEGTVVSAKNAYGPFLTADFTHPSAVEENVALYCKYGLPFVMGTTGGDQEAIRKLVEGSGNTAVVAPNMAMPIVALQAAFNYISKKFPGAFTGLKLSVTESHQSSKADTSGTAKSMIKYFNELGCEFDPANIKMVRDPQAQLAMGIPEEFLAGHGWHDYRLESEDGAVCIALTHNVNGRKVYVDGVMAALEFLEQKVERGETGFYSMIDVLSGA